MQAKLLSIFITNNFHYSVSEIDILANKSEVYEFHIIKANFVRFSQIKMQTQKDQTPPTTQESISLLRRLGAIFYDSFLLLTVLFVASFLIVIPTGIKPEDPYFLIFQLYIFAIAYLFFAWCWTRSGQTLGMRTWKMKVVNEDGSIISYKTALLRFMVSIISWLAIRTRIFMEPMGQTTPHLARHCF